MTRQFIICLSFWHKSLLDNVVRVPGFRNFSFIHCDVRKRQRSHVEYTHKKCLFSKSSTSTLVVAVWTTKRTKIVLFHPCATIDYVSFVFDCCIIVAVVCCKCKQFTDFFPRIIIYIVVSLDARQSFCTAPSLSFVCFVICVLLLFCRSVTVGGYPRSLLSAQNSLSTSVVVWRPLEQSNVISLGCPPPSQIHTHTGSNLTVATEEFDFGRALVRQIN